MRSISLFQCLADKCTIILCNGPDLKTMPDYYPANKCKSSFETVYEPAHTWSGINWLPKLNVLPQIYSTNCIKLNAVLEPKIKCY
ncbi:MAG: hypothetical protein DRQ59_05840 [Gammaproteobacteria bacterium]|nr:MAG: hypothetical protein DRQ59_05840 [Gammaproteobacteria bacterium]